MQRLREFICLSAEAAEERRDEWSRFAIAQSVVATGTPSSGTLPTDAFFYHRFE